MPVSLITAKTKNEWRRQAFLSPRKRCCQFPTPLWSSESASEVLPRAGPLTREPIPQLEWKRKTWPPNSVRLSSAQSRIAGSPISSPCSLTGQLSEAFRLGGAECGSRCDRPSDRLSQAGTSYHRPLLIVIGCRRIAACASDLRRPRNRVLATLCVESGGIHLGLLEAVATSVRPELNERVRKALMPPQTAFGFWKQSSLCF